MDLDFGRAFAAEPARTVGRCGWIRHLDFHIVEFEVGSGGHGDGFYKIEGNAFQSYPPCDKQRTVVSKLCLFRSDTLIFTSSSSRSAPEATVMASIRSREMPFSLTRPVISSGPSCRNSVFSSMTVPSFKAGRFFCPNTGTARVRNRQRKADFIGPSASKHQGLSGSIPDRFACG